MQILYECPIDALHLVFKKPLMRKSPKSFKVVSGGYWNCAMNALIEIAWGLVLMCYFISSKSLLIECHLSKKNWHK